MDTLSGKNVRHVEGAILWNSNYGHDISAAETSGFDWSAAGRGGTRSSQTFVPDGHRVGGVGPEAYDGYRKGLDSACADIVVYAIPPRGDAVVVATKRAQGKCFGGSWWMQGGAIHSYRSIPEFVLARAEAECGVRPQISAMLGVFRTCAGDVLASTTNLCYAGSVPYEALQTARHDEDHAGLHLLTLAEIRKMSEEELHWYPHDTFVAVLDVLSGL